MSTEIFIPIDRIEQGAKVILYGAGNNGEKIWLQNAKLKWCNICAVVDGMHSRIIDFPVAVTDPESTIKKYEYDYILISVAADKPKREIMNALRTWGVKEACIIEAFPNSLPDKNIPIIEYKDTNINSERLQIGFYPGGVMGDNLIALKLYQELVKLVPNCEIDVLVYFKVFPEAIFGRQKNLRKIIYRTPNEEDKNTYDLIIQSHFEPSIVYCNMQRVEQLAPVLAGKLKILYEYQNSDLFTCPISQYMNRLQWDRAKFKGWNCYTLLGSSGAFDIHDTYVDFDVNNSYENEYKSLNLSKQYITYNFGASDPLKDGKRQTKMWPYEYHCELNKMIKRAFPNIELVQLGASDVTKVPGADRYILGENLEVTKYILKNAILHFDCEGGLVHLATQLGTKCFVVFGPTPVSFFGYEENTNIVSEKCKECCGLIKDWYTRCYKYKRPECMYAIYPKKVFLLIKEYLENLN